LPYGKNRIKGVGGEPRRKKVKIRSLIITEEEKGIVAAIVRWDLGEKPQSTTVNFLREG